jgi:hypothetical protein
MSKKPLSLYSVQELLLRAAEFDEMAASARTTSARQSLERLAARFRVMAAGRAADPSAIDRQTDAAPDPMPVHLPGESASWEGAYQEVNVFVTPTGQIVRARRGEPLPAAPRGYTWRLASELVED